ncbi:hypothetical protein WMY93_029820 [Mugilogobius chulae]|uniref:Uncharacterized protein n=1 Tax=Mugilogobius chulae TaxID=88201 RepID=A0AAW0MSA8_9GOBI
MAEDRELSARAGVCDLHFTHESFSNFTEVELGFLENGAVPTLALPRTRPSTLLPSPPGASPLTQQPTVHGGLRSLEPKGTREIGCQTDPVLTKYACVQANLKPPRRSKAVQARAPNRSVSCDTGSLMDIPFPENPSASSTPLKERGWICLEHLTQASIWMESNEVGNSVRMEKEGIGKKIDALTKLKGMKDVGMWRKSLVNHLYWSATTSASGEEVVAKWISVANHIQNVPLLSA